MDSRLKRYSHAFTIAFEVDSDNDAENVTAEELYAGLERRIADLRAQDERWRNDPKYSPEILEACRPPFDSYDRQAEEEAS